MKRTAAMIAVALACALGATGAWAAGPEHPGVPDSLFCAGLLMA